MLLSKENVNPDNFKIGYSGVVKAEALKSKTTDGGYGILFYGNGIKYGKTYYTIPYAIYVNESGNTITVYGDNIIKFVPEY